MRPVFISYKSEEFDQAKWVKDFLESNGIDCWMAPMCITGGSSYAAEIPQAIREAQVFVLILSKTCQTSKWVPRELDQAINDGKVIMPFMIEDCELVDEFQFYLTNVQRYTAYQNKEKNAEKMLREIEDVLGITHVAEEDEKPEPAPKTVAKVEVKKKAKVKKKKFSAKKLAFFVAGFVGIILAFVLIGELNKVTIAGQKIKKSEEYLRFTDVTVTDEDMEAIAGLKKVRHIWFENCKIEAESLGALSKPELYVLGFHTCGVSDEQFSTIAFDKMERLSTLCLYKNAISNIEILKPVCDTLTVMNISYTKVTDLKIIESMERLTTVCADGLGLTGLQFLKNASDLKVLSVNKNQLSSFDGLEKCLFLECVFAGENKIYDTDGLSNATKLQVLYLNDNGVDESDLQFLDKSSETLVELYIDENYVNNLEFLMNCTKLKRFSACGNEIENLSPLKKMKQLSTLALENNSILKVDALKECEKLHYLDLSSNRIEDADVLLQHEGLLQDGFLDLSYNQIQKISVEKQGGFFIIDIHENLINDLELSKDAKMSYFIMDYWDGLSIDELSESSIMNMIMYRCPLDKQLDVQEAMPAGTQCYEGRIDDAQEMELDNIKSKAGIGLGNIGVYMDSAVIF